MATVFNSVATVLAAVGQDLGVTEYITIDQKRIDTFADATGRASGPAGIISDGRFAATFGDPLKSPSEVVVGGGLVLNSTTTAHLGRVDAGGAVLFARRSWRPMALVLPRHPCESVQMAESIPAMHHASLVCVRPNLQISVIRASDDRER